MGGTGSASVPKLDPVKEVGLPARLKLANLSVAAHRTGAGSTKLYRRRIVSDGRSPNNVR